MKGKKIKTWRVDIGGENIINDSLQGALDSIELLTGNTLENQEPEKGEDSVEIIITIERKYTSAELDAMPEYQ